MKVRDVVIPQTTNVTSSIQKPAPGGMFELKQNMVQLLHTNGDIFVGTDRSNAEYEMSLGKQQAQINMNLEKQFGQFASAQNSRPQGDLPGNTDPNSKQVNVVSTRSGRPLEELPPKAKVAEEKGTHVDEAEPSEQRVNEEPKAKPPPPFPQKFKKQKEEECFGKFIKLLKQVHVNLLDVLQGIPKYAKYVKDVVANKSRLAEYATIALTKECSSRIQNKLPIKLKDPGSFNVQITIGRPKSTIIMLQLAYRSVAMPDGVIEDVLVQVETLIFPVDFVILDFEPDPEVPFILGYPFLATEVIDEAMTSKYVEAQDPSEKVLIGQDIEGDVEAQELANVLNVPNVEPINRVLGPPPKPSIEEAPELELKALPSHLRYAFLGANESLHVIFSSALSELQIEASLKILRKRKRAI
ncbi:uncharacterized protein LOC125855316 [Solanum stenotomum]|uniref:uncharacterized protein LOC125855316 n=1 Tax=Solanum stenotomum TaxID=172797 RepID=UPI0020D01768|nr:uncharacterized protein LOC125855316 [Solanum stenotomum]